MYNTKIMFYFLWDQTAFFLYHVCLVFFQPLSFFLNRLYGPTWLLGTLPPPCCCCCRFTRFKFFFLNYLFVFFSRDEGSKRRVFGGDQHARSPCQSKSKTVQKKLSIRWVAKNNLYSTLKSSFEHTIWSLFIELFLLFLSSKGFAQSIHHYARELTYHWY